MHVSLFQDNLWDSRLAPDCSWDCADLALSPRNPKSCRNSRVAMMRLEHGDRGSIWPALEIKGLPLRMKKTSWKLRYITHENSMRSLVVTYLSPEKYVFEYLYTIGTPKWNVLIHMTEIDLTDWYRKSNKIGNRKSKLITRFNENRFDYCHNEQ